MAEKRELLTVVSTIITEALDFGVFWRHLNLYRNISGWKEVRTNKRAFFFFFLFFIGRVLFLGSLLPFYTLHL